MSTFPKHQDMYIQRLFRVVLSQDDHSSAPLGKALEHMVARGSGTVGEYRHHASKVQVVGPRCCSKLTIRHGSWWYLFFGGFTSSDDTSPLSRLDSSITF